MPQAKHVLPAGAHAKMLAFPATPASALRVTQVDLEEYFLLRREMREARAAFRAKADEVAAKLRDGAAVEDGVHIARLDGSRLVVE